MPFDGVVYTDPVAVRRAACHPSNPTVGLTPGNMLRNAFVYSRWRSRGGVAIAYPRNLRIPAGADYWAPMIVDTGGSIILRDRRLIAAHWTHLCAQVCFTITDDADSANISVGATDGTNTNQTSKVVPISTGSDARIPEGDTAFEGRNAAYEAILSLPLFVVPMDYGITAQPGLTLGGLITVTINGAAWATSSDATPVKTMKTMVLDSLSTWLECQESTL